MEYGFTEGTDFISILGESTGGRPSEDHALKLDMAKEISMIQRNEKGKEARQPVPNGNNAPAPGLIRTWIGPAAAAVVMMAVCGAASRVVFGFLY